MSPNLAPQRRNLKRCLHALRYCRKFVKLIMILILAYLTWLFCFGSLFKTRSTTSFIPDRNIYYIPLYQTFSNHSIPIITKERKTQTVKQPAITDVNGCFEIERFVSRQTEIDQLNHRISNSFECSHVVYFEDGGKVKTGNQLFRVATVLSLASKHGYTAVISPSVSHLQWFDLPNVALVKLENKYTFQDRACCKYDRNIEFLPRNKNWTIKGYFQSWKYFTSAEHIIRSALRLKAKYLQTAQNFINKVCSIGTQCISLHVRRGDFLLLENYGLNVAPLTYMHKAMLYFKRKYANTHFIIVSDDKDWCNAHLSSDNVTISPFIDDVGSDMALMVQSDHVIMTSGTFGWWGAWLSGGDVVYWRGYPKNGSFVGNQTNIEDFYLPHWIGID